MRKINYGLIVSDFDGTLVNHDGTILPATKECIAQYVRDGGRFAISTGRMPIGILSWAQELGLKGAVSCCNGAVIVDIESKKVLFEKKLPHRLAIDICRKLEAMDLHIHAYGVWDFYCNKDDEALKLYKKLVGTQARLILDRPLSDYLEESGADICKFLIMIEPERNESVRLELEKEGFTGCVVTKSADFLVEVINANQSKGTAVEFLSDYYGVPIEKTIGVGDQWNDIPMVERAGLGIAVQNADARLKERADLICERTNEQGAIEEIINKYGYTED